MPTPTIENYLKVIFHLTKESDEVSTTDIAKSLEVSLPTVNNMAKKLAERGYLHYTKYQPLKITEKGKKEAALIIRKHRLTEMYLVEKMGFKWDEVHAVAEQVEHIHSDLLFEKMDEILGRPEFDPHGSPIPTKEGKVAKRNLIRLSEAESQKTYTLISLENTAVEFLQYLDNRGIYLGMNITITGKDDFAGSLLLAYDDQKNVTLTAVIAEKLLVS